MSRLNLIVEYADMHIGYVVNYVEYYEWYWEQRSRHQVNFTDTVHLIFMRLQFVSIAYVTQKTVAEFY